MADRNNIQCALVNIAGGFIFGYLAIGVSSGFYQFWPCMYDTYGENDTLLNTSLVSMVNIGAMLGALGAPRIINKLQFRKTLILGSILGLFSIWSSFAFSYAQQAIARLICGLGIGLISSTGPQYVDKYASVSVRGSLGSLFQVSMTFAIMTASVCVYFLLGDDRDEEVKVYCNLTSVSWIEEQNFYLNIPGIICCVILFMIAVTLSDSERNEDNDGDGLLKSISSPNMSTPMRSWYIGVMGTVAMQLTGINAVMFYSALFFEPAHFEQKVLGNVFVMTWNFLTTLVALKLVDRVGRRPLLVPAMGVIFISLVVLTPFELFIKVESVQAVLTFVCLAAYIAAFEFGPGCLFWVICNEIFPNGSPAFPRMNALQWCFTLVVTFFFPPLQELIGAYVFLVFSVPAFITFVFYYFYLPETKGMEKDALLDLLRRSNTAEPFYLSTTRRSEEHAI